MRFVLLVLLAVLLPAGLTRSIDAQVVARPTDPPIVTADDESWFAQREPLQLGGDIYYPAGPRIFFDGNTMVRTGHYNGVPLYADATLEPYSVIYVPVSGRRMQPYERRRAGELAGTTGSRTPSFPVSATSSSPAIPEAPSAPTNVPSPIGAIGVFTPETGAAATTGVAPTPAGAVSSAPRSAPTPRRMSEAELRAGIWVDYRGERWISAGAAVPLDPSAFVQVGERAGFPVYVKAGQRDDVIFMPAANGLLTPYRRK